MSPTTDMSIADSNMLFSDLPMHIQDKFQAIAYKSDSGQTARQFFHTEVPDISKADPEAVELLLDGGTVLIPQDVYHQGAGGVQTEAVEYTLPDRDFSRIESGANGGDYTSDNVVLEDMSINRSRGAEDMTDVEYESATDALQGDADILSNRLGDVADVGTSDLTAAAEVSGESVLETAFESVLPISMGVKGAHSAWQATSHLPNDERVAVTALAGGGSVLATYTLLAVPGVNILVAGYGIWQLTKLACAGIDHVTKNA